MYSCMQLKYVKNSYKLGAVEKFYTFSLEIYFCSKFTREYIPYSTQIMNCARLYGPVLVDHQQQRLRLLFPVNGKNPMFSLCRFYIHVCESVQFNICCEQQFTPRQSWYQWQLMCLRLTTIYLLGCPHLHSIRALVFSMAML